MKKTVAQIAKEIGVSKQAIHKRINQEPLKTSLQEVKITEKNRLYFDVSGEKLIKSAFKKKAETKSIKELKKKVDTLQKDLEKSLSVMEDFVTGIRLQYALVGIAKSFKEQGRDDEMIKFIMLYADNVQRTTDRLELSLNEFNDKIYNEKNS